MKSIIKKLTICILVFSLAISAFGCKDEESGNGSGLYVYYLNKAGDELTKEQFKAKSDNANNQISDLLDALSEAGSNKNHKAAVPSNVVVNGFNLNNGIVTVDFNKSYNQMSNQREVMCRAAVVLTLIQVNAVDGIEFTIDNVAFEKETGTKLGIMNASSFVSNLRGVEDEFAKADFLLYFSNESGKKLKKYELKNAKYGSKTKEEFIVETLIEGPKKSGYKSTISDKVKLNSVSTSNNICYVDFDDSFLKEHSEVSDEQCIYSIVNSLSELNDVHEVQFTVNKDSNIKYHKKISLDEPFIRNLDLVE